MSESVGRPEGVARVAFDIAVAPGRDWRTAGVGGLIGRGDDDAAPPRVCSKILRRMSENEGRLGVAAGIDLGLGVTLDRPCETAGVGGLIGRADDEAVPPRACSKILRRMSENEERLGVAAGIDLGFGVTLDRLCGTAFGCGREIIPALDLPKLGTDRGFVAADRSCLAAATPREVLARSSSEAFLACPPAGEGLGPLASAGNATKRRPQSVTAIRAGFGRTIVAAPMRIGWVITWPLSRRVAITGTLNDSARESCAAPQRAIGRHAVYQCNSC